MLLKFKNLTTRNATATDSEQLGFKKLHININSCTNQVGEIQSSIDYELYQSDCCNFAR